MESRLEFVRRIFVSEQTMQTIGMRVSNFVVPFISQFFLVAYLASVSELSQEIPPLNKPFLTRCATLLIKIGDFQS